MGRPKSNTKSKSTQSCAETAQSRRINHAQKTITRKDNEINNDDDISDENDESFLRKSPPWSSRERPSAESPSWSPRTKERPSAESPLWSSRTRERPSAESPPWPSRIRERPSAEFPPWSPRTRERPSAESSPWPSRTRERPSAEFPPWSPRTRERPSAESSPWPSRTRERPSAESPLWSPRTRERPSAESSPERVKRRRNERGKDDDDDDNYSVPPQFESITNQLQICNWLVENPAILQLATQMLNMKDTSQLALAVHASSASSASSEHVNHEKYRLIDEEIKCLFLRSRFPSCHLFDKLVRKVFPELEAYSSMARSIVDRCRRSFSDYRYQLRVSIEELVREFQSKSERRGTTVSEVEINDFISRDVIIKRIFNQYFTAVDVSEIPEITINKLIEFSKECFNIAWEGRDETNTRVFYDQIKTLDKNTEVLEIPSRNTGDKREDNNDDAKKVKKIKKDNDELVATVTDKLNTNVFNLSFALWNVLRRTDVKTFTMNIDTGLIQLMKSGGVLHVRSASDSTSTLETKANEVSIPYNFSRIGSDNRKVGDLGIKVEYFNKPVKLLNTAAELVAKNLYQLLQYSDRLPDNPPSQDNLIFKHSEDYRNRLIEYLSSINHKDEFSTFKGAISIDLNKMESTSSDTIIIDEADATGNDFGFLEEQTYSLESLLSVNKEERNIKVKEAIKNLSSRVWTLELFCALKPRKQGQTIKSQVTKKILKESNGRLDEKDLTLYLQRGFRIERVLNSIGVKWNILDAIDNLTPCFFTSTINGCQNFKIWLEIILSNEVILYNEAEIRYKQFKATLANERVMCMKQACGDCGVEFQPPSVKEFNFDF
ncbi:trinucleotide repeat-containing gene 6C protein [Rhizophagus clarus]|uniref:Trinucleotide repeat-containing gene 6C protein n=1 Tax=Rhizophagus clarus TaxID=94130 RepID=A0A8H3M3C0_9GLOM|nr:trinucleotide repeat-containing gene 6C protein [Rhizophagus clarus]